MKMIIDTVMCDYGGVVADHYSDPFLKYLANELGTTRKGARDLVSECTPYGRQYRLKQINKTEFWSRVRELAPKKDFDDDYVQELWAKTYIPNVAVLNLLGYLKDEIGVKTGIVMNEDIWRYKFIQDNYEMEKYADLIVASFEVGTVKPEKAMYEVVLQKCGRKDNPERALYIDDRQTHVDPAIGCGMHGYVYLNSGDLNNFFETINFVKFEA